MKIIIDATATNVSIRVAKGNSTRTVLSSSVDARSGEEVARLVARMVGGLIADHVTEQAGGAG